MNPTLNHINAGIELWLDNAKFWHKLSNVSQQARENYICRLLDAQHALAVEVRRAEQHLDREARPLRDCTGKCC